MGALTEHGGAEVELSIIVPFFNAEDYLSDCLDSILGQSFSDFELLLVDDGSTDASAQIGERYCLQDSRIRIFHITQGGVSLARNVGLQHARGEYVHFVDSDDLLEPECCQTFHQLATQSNPDLVVSGAYLVDHNMRITGGIASPGKGVNKVEGLLGSLTPATKATLLHYVWNKWYRLALIREHGLQFDGDLRLGEDFLFNCDYWETCRTVALSEQALYRYCRRSPTSLTGRFRADELSRRRRMDARLFALYAHFGMLDDRQRMLDELVGSIALDSLSSVVGTDCPLSWGGRVAFIRSFIDSEYAEFVSRYAASSRASAVARLQGALMRMGTAVGLYLLMWSVAQTKGLR